jgi:UDP-N-acetylmuramoyl-tripeptide--D-alanyl-D-alanine ligase
MDASNDIYAKNVENLGLDGLKCDISTPAGEFTAHIHIPGMHMVYNALAGTCVGLACGLTIEEIKTGIENAKTISGRNNLIHTKKFTIMDDCYNANPVSMKASLDVLSTALGRTVAILGDMGELGTNEKELHFGVGVHAAEKQIDLLLCAGTLSAEIAKGAKSVSPEMDVRLFETRDALMEQLPQLLADGDSILVKASHFMQFDKIVKALEE